MHIYDTPTIPFNARGLGDLAEAFSFMEKLVEQIAPAMKVRLLFFVILLLPTLGRLESISSNHPIQ
jgi:hypothetical protein